MSMENPQPFLSLNNISIRYLDKTLFQNLDFHIKQGEHWALTGESGSGKSALLQTIAGNFSLINGTIQHHYYKQYLLKNPLEDVYFNHRKLIALVTPRHHFKNLSHTSDFYYQQRYNSSDSEDSPTVQDYLSEIKSSVKNNPFWTFDTITDRLNLENLLSKQLIKLSNGETKRLIIAAALLKNPVLLMLDNPFIGLDVQSRADFHFIIADIIRSGITVILATSPEEIPEKMTHVAILKEGKIIKTVSKKDFQPEMVKMNNVANLDEDELKNLLSLTVSTAYKDIVIMEAVNIRYGDQQILNQVNWHVRQGERWALTGPNGAGKSTLLSLINGDNPQAYANNIVLFDRKRGSGESIWDIKKKIGFVSPELHQYFATDTSCLQVVESGFYDTLGLFRSVNKSQASIALQWMCMLEIENYKNQLFKNVSASVQRVCLLTRALVKSPPLLILDEPCQGLDPHQRNHFKQIVDSICAATETTLIYVSHYQEEIPSCVTRILQLQKGNAIS